MLQANIVIVHFLQKMFADFIEEGLISEEERKRHLNIEVQYIKEDMAMTG